MKELPDYYQLLHVQPDAPTEVIKVSFRTLMLTLDHHPDRGGNHYYAAQLNEAYHVLVDQERRREYDRARAQNGSSPKAPATAAKKPAGKQTVCTVCPFCKTTLWETPGAAICSSCGSPLGDALGPIGVEGYGRSMGRLPRPEPITYYTSWPGSGKQGQLCDCSPGGMRFRANSEVRPGQMLKIDRSTMKATGRVVYCQPAQQDGFDYIIGVEIQAVSFGEAPPNETG